MKPLQRIALVGLVPLWCLPACTAQSLGDVARQQQADKTSAPKTKHVITNDDIAPVAKPADTSSKTSKKKSTPGSPAPADANADRPSAQQIQTTIKEQRERILDVEEQLKDIEKKQDIWKTSDCTHVMHANSSINACDEVQRLNSEHETVKAQLAQEKKNLADMQEDARKMGYGNTVYDPN